MSREIKRVPLTFNWPLNQKWEGYLLPDKLRANPCETCQGKGTTVDHELMLNLIRLILMTAEDTRAQKRNQELHPYLQNINNMMNGTHRNPLRPTEHFLQLVEGLTGSKADSLLMFSTTDEWRLLNKLTELAGMDDKWGWCTNCNGEGYIDTYEGQTADRNAWKPTEPPTGEGWQMWETVSEGSPVSPVMETPEDLAQWIADGGYTLSKLTYQQALNFVTAGWAPSGIYTPSTGVVDGVKAVGDNTI